ncbi:flavin-containing monooxygenase [Nocardioides stalactiti]|uniref:flavin-containing monooxygenase n=1 Tax=Nocardioides stalactiti TaxID=2755356 RepID=UPI0028A952CB|nr:NAD(P)/FAD-dependent oxidoreductase [Nocardioides stalactiti]
MKKPQNQTQSAIEELDVVIVGAGITGIGAAHYITQAFPDRRVTVLEGRADIGGTWDLFRYPGIRSDSDLHTFGYEFKPWKDRSAIADAPLIRNYLHETVEEHDLARLIRLRHRVVAAAWSSAEAAWTLDVEVDGPDGAVAERKQIRTNWVFAGTGYYRYDEGYTPHFEGREDFEGDIIHPQHWPEGFDYAGKDVVVIGSGATAVTLIPSMASGPGAAAHVTMLQRTPTYILSFPRVDSLALLLTRLFGERRGYALTRFKNIWLDRATVVGLRKFPRAGRALIRRVNKRLLPKGFDVDTHFNPPYDPWDQRLCLAPDGDFFTTIRDGKASVVTDKIERFTRTGVLLESGRHLEADVIVTATGLNMRLFGGIQLTVDGRSVDVADSVSYRGMLLSGIPNWAMAVGYTTSSWTLKIGLICRYFTRLLAHMDASGYDAAVAVAEPGMETRPVMDLSSGYAQRAAGIIPRQGTKAPWRMALAYPEDAKLLRGPLFDDSVHFSSRADRTVGEPSAVHADA